MNKSTFRDDLSGYIRGHVAKSIAPFRMFGIEHTSPTQNIHPSELLKEIREKFSL